MFDSSKCETCPNVDCLTRCQWIQFENAEEARAEQLKMIQGEDSRVLNECVQCFACNEYCPFEVKPFYLRIALQEKYNSHQIAPAMVDNSIKKYEYKDEFKPMDLDVSKPILNKCAFVKTNAKNFEGKLFEGLQSVAGRPYFCNLVYHHLDNDSVTLERAKALIERIKLQGIKEMICFHDECYALYASYCPAHGIEVPFKPIHLFEYLLGYLKDHQADVEKLNLKIAYQRNCSNRNVPETDKLVDEICHLIGVERVARKYDRETALCCTGPFNMIGKKKLVRKTMDDNVQDILDNGAEAVIYNCPMCMEMMASKTSRKGLKNYLISDLCRLAIGEQLD